MTDTKAPTLDIDEQIAFMKTGLPAAAISGSAKVVGSMKAILASLERLRDAEKALPEPVAWCVVYEGPPTCGKIHSDPTMYKPTAEAIVKNGAPGLSVASLYPESALLAEVAKRQAAESELAELRRSDRAALSVIRALLTALVHPTPPTVKQWAEIRREASKHLETIDKAMTAAAEGGK